MSTLQPSTPRPSAEMLAALRADLATTRSHRGPALGFGLPAIDERLADHGLDAGGLHEIAAASEALTDDAAATLFLAGIAARFCDQPDFTMLWAVTAFDLYAPGLEQVGLAPEKVLYGQGRKDAEVLAMAEDARWNSHGVVIWRSASASGRHVVLPMSMARRSSLQEVRPHMKASRKSGGVQAYLAQPSSGLRKPMPSTVSPMIGVRVFGR
ncbi:Damage-inducible mutagenesis protein [Sphingobium yanoikuyae]|jgi:hypothetical protein|uniref:Damage-inducible mutagenesis protein n=2 Tax=Sphingomonadaceae TaxID=41297 RepID=A0A084EPH1_SPHYA|nr:Damage-inducible mutagenesis protein [Novosphingobium resinovorum]KEZ19863.1 Damage-inducible mutagenesis protein [Sphingobium yanoikuyae]